MTLTNDHYEGKRKLSPMSEKLSQTPTAAALVGLKLPHLIPPIIIPLQRETRGALPEMHWIYGTVIFPPTPPINPLQRETRGALPEVHWIYGAVYQYLLLTTFPERITHKLQYHIRCASSA